MAITTMELLELVRDAEGGDVGGETAEGLGDVGELVGHRRRSGQSASA